LPLTCVWRHITAIDCCMSQNSCSCSVHLLPDSSAQLLARILYPMLFYDLILLIGFRIRWLFRPEAELRPEKNAVQGSTS
jgi:hypothetical protein